jgi:hypothetical protein
MRKAMAGEVRGQDRQCGRKQPRVGARSLVQKRKERLVWGETPFLTHPGAGKWVGRRTTTRQLSGYSVANKKGGANTADRASTAHMQPRIAQLTPLDTQTPGEQIYSLRSKATAGPTGLITVACNRCGSTVLFDGPTSPVNCIVHSLVHRRCSIAIVELGTAACRSTPLIPRRMKSLLKT